MKLVFVNGDEKGREVTLSPPFISIGRETDNDVVLKQEAVSRYHAKIEKDGSIWVVRDLNSSNGVRVNGQKIEESAPVSNRDEIRIGDAIFSVFDENSSDAGAVLDLTAKKDDEKEGKKTDKSKEAVKKRVNLLIASLLTVIVVVAAGVYLTSGSNGKKGNGDPLETSDLDEAELHVFYKHEESGWDDRLKDYNISVYEAHIDGNNLRVQVHNVADGVEIPEKQARISDEEIADLKSKILRDSLFISETSLPPRRLTDRHERIRLMVRAGHIGNYLEYVNDSPQIPQSVKEAIMQIKSLIERKVNIPRLSRREAFDEAQRLYALANRLYDERTVYPQNLYNAYRNAQQAEHLLRDYQELPPFYKKLVALLEKTKDLHREATEDLFKQAQIQEQTAPDAALQTYRKIMERIPNSTDEAHRRAKNKTLELEQELTKGRR